MLIINLGDGWWMAFDTVHCSIYKLWQGEIELTGAVYDTKHGPQPMAKGRFVLNGHFPVEFKSERQVPAKWRGYQVQNGRVLLHWQVGDVSVKLSPTLSPDSVILDLELDSPSETSGLIAHVPSATAMTTEPLLDADAGAVVGTVGLPPKGDVVLKLYTRPTSSSPDEMKKENE
jgi:hypothetical protein